MASVELSKGFTESVKCATQKDLVSSIFNPDHQNNIIPPTLLVGAGRVRGPLHSSW